MMTQRPLSITSAGFSTMADRPSIRTSASEGDFPMDDETAFYGSLGVDTDSTDLNREVAALSNKLIKSINHQTKLDDSLSATKHELELSKARIRQLEQVAQEHNEMLEQGILVEKKQVESETQQLLERLNEEILQRGQAEKDKRHIEQELENLTTALFDEANKMVSAARMERDAMDRKNEQLKAQLADTETLLASHQEQLAELKAVMQQMTKDRVENEANARPPTPSTGNRHSKESMGRIFESLHLIPNSMGHDMPPCPPTSLINLVHPVLRHDIAAYHDFCDVLTPPKPTEEKPSPISRLSGHSFGSIQMMGMGISALGSPNATSGLFGMKKRAEVALTAHSPTGSTSSTYDSQIALQALKETKFFKRVMLEDVEPTLRLDNAPGLSWLARRNVQSAITEGVLVIDPMPSSPKVNIFACALCGESKADEQHARTHRMRTSDNPNAQRYPLCWYCTNRLRSVCDFMAFLRTLKEGLWKCDGPGDQMHAWEESVKLRERMFWARVGGGVVPAFLNRDSTRNSIDASNGLGQTETPPRTPLMGGIQVRDTLNVPKIRNIRNDPFHTPEKHQSSRIPLAPSPLNLSDGVLDIDDDRTIDYEGLSDREQEEMNQVQSSAPINALAITSPEGTNHSFNSELFTQTLAKATISSSISPEDFPLPDSPSVARDGIHGNNSMMSEGKSTYERLPSPNDYQLDISALMDPPLRKASLSENRIPGGW